MAQDLLKTAWQGMNTETKNYNDLQHMVREKTHPVLKGIRKQLIIEIAAFTIFLVVYYDFFDGDKKPWWANLLLVSAMVFVIVYNLVGYWLTQRRIKGSTLQQSLGDQLNKMKTYAVAFMASRTLAIASLLIFFGSVISFNTTKYWIMAGILLTVLIQLGLLSWIWLARIRRLRKIMHSLQAD
jgi:hypothetical protein